MYLQSERALSAGVAHLLNATKAPVQRILLIVALCLGLAACNGELVDASAVPIATQPVLSVLKDPSCGCCALWVDHVTERGFVAQISHPADLNLEKLERGIAPQYQSCHTAVSSEGFVFEGHVPANLIQRFLDEKPENSLGLAVPGMPLGSPGMELGEQFQPYDVLLLKADGSAEVYARINTKTEQY